ncbi:hypothetical protein [Kineococcus terrestris]|uniref:hypothetical protein n=1 Tax=Kineococcus terrestris TaxID=2044856 RepID=UPI0034DAEB1B
MPPDDTDLRDLVISEVDDARDIYELAQQLEQFMPIESFDRLAEATRDRRLRFRDTEFDVESLRGLLPSIAFPVADLRSMVARLGELVRGVPPTLGVDLDSESGVARMRRARGELLPGVAPRRDNAVAVAVASLRGQEPSDTTVPTGPEQ